MEMFEGEKIDEEMMPILRKASMIKGSSLDASVVKMRKTVVKIEESYMKVQKKQNLLGSEDRFHSVRSQLLVSVRVRVDCGSIGGQTVH